MLILDRKRQQRAAVRKVDVGDNSLGGEGWSMMGEEGGGCCEDSDDVHLLSFGTKNLLVELWANAATENTILVRLSQSTTTSCISLGSQTLKLKIPAGKWNHLAVTCRQKSLHNQQVDSFLLNISPDPDDIYQDPFFFVE